MSAERLVTALSGLGQRWKEAEVYLRQGRSRGLDLDHGTRRFRDTVESGWALRVGSETTHRFVAGSGPLPSDALALSFGSPVMEGALGLPPRLRDPVPGELPKSEPLASEAEAHGWGRRVLEGLAERDIGEQQFFLRLEDGEATSWIANHRGVDAVAGRRVASLRASLAGRRDQVGVRAWGRTWRDFEPAALVETLVDRLAARSGPAAAPGAGVRTWLLAPPVVAFLLDSLTEAWVDRGAFAALASTWRASRPRFWPENVSLRDDPAAVGRTLDGEGVPTLVTPLIRRGRIVQPLASWRDPARGAALAGGCHHRDSYRDWPRRTVTAAVLEIEDAAPLAELVGKAMEAGPVLYLLDVLPEASASLSRDRVRLAAYGHLLRRGTRPDAVGSFVWEGSLLHLLGELRGGAGEAIMIPGRRGLIGAPTLALEPPRRSEGPDR